VTSARLRILATTDLHAHALGWDYFRDEPVQGRGLAALVPLIVQARADCPDCILVDNGDILQGSPLGDWTAEAGRGPHPMIVAMNALGYDAVTIGNHEFSHGLDLLSDALADARFPVVSANVAIAGCDRLRRDTILTRTLAGADGTARAIRIGVTGTAPSQTAIWEARNMDGRVTLGDPVTAARDAVHRLRADGADIVILLAHTGLGDGSGTENVGIALAETAGADALILGHAHQTYSGGTPALAVPAVMAGCFGSHLGCIDLDLQLGPAGWKVTGARSQVIPSGHPAPPEALPPATVAAHEATRAWLHQPAGHVDRPLRAHFARIAPCDLIRFVASAQVDHVRTVLSEGQIDGRPVLATAAPFRIGSRGAAGGCSDVPAGPLMLRHVNDLYPHPNTLVALSVTGQDIGDWLERAAVQFTTLCAGQQDLPILRADCPAFDFDLIDDLSFRIDPTAPPRFDQRGTLVDGAAHRIGDIRHRGRPVDADDRFILVTNSYRASGSGGFPACRGDRILLDEATPLRRVLQDFLGKGASWQRQESWCFASLGLSALFEAPSDAASYVDDIGHLRPELLASDDPDGPCRFRLWL